MGKIKDFCGKWFDDEFWELGLLFLVVAAVSIGVQSLIFWIGGLFPSVEDCGMLIDSVLCALLVLPLLIGAGLTEGEGNGNIIVGLLAIMGIYVSVVWYFQSALLHRRILCDDFQWS